ncbi:MAG: mannose-6-phosphate isomerase [Candidatus Izimaplasma sp.]|nr:mannose-6-phosphate isomerase [Candidatus Izimaplasma bacterium]
MIIFFNPIFFDKIWGGNKIGKFLNFTVNDNCGECWGISTHKNGLSTIKNGVHMGKTLKYIFDNHKELFGFYQGKEFPILVKIIDAKQDLSIQVHPDDEYAKQSNSFGKTECWYILEAETNAKLIIGHNFLSKKELIAQINSPNFVNNLHKFGIKKDDYYFINSGTIHAICAGTLLLEVQQSSDITYRVFDYNRLDDGKLRQLHIEEAKNVIKVPDSQLIRTHNNKYFDYIVSSIFKKKSFISHPHGDYIVVLEGIGKINKLPIKRGDFLMVSSNFTYILEGNFKIQTTWF